MFSFLDRFNLFRSGKPLSLAAPAVAQKKVESPEYSSCSEKVSSCVKKVSTELEVVSIQTLGADKLMLCRNWGLMGFCFKEEECVGAHSEDDLVIVRVDKSFKAALCHLQAAADDSRKVHDKWLCDFRHSGERLILLDPEQNIWGVTDPSCDDLIFRKVSFSSGFIPS